VYSPVPIMSTSTRGDEGAAAAMAELLLLRLIR
jgi:hypothetical protein